MGDTFRKVSRELAEHERAAIESIKDHAEQIEIRIKRKGPTREASLAMTKLEEAVMWAVKHITA